MSTMTAEILTDLVKNYKGRSPGGIDCKFVKIDDKWGIKTYQSPATRTKAYDRQKKLAEYGLAPAVGISFDIGDEYKYCYVTEIAQPLVEGVTDARDCGRYSTEYRNIEHDMEIVGWATEVKEKMKQHGFTMLDGHLANFGILRDKVVCIDFAE